MEDQVVCMIGSDKTAFSFEIFRSPDYQTTCYAISEHGRQGGRGHRGCGWVCHGTSGRMAFETEDKEMLSKAYQEILVSRPTAST
jgi:hypothetical protein